VGETTAIKGGIERTKNENGSWACLECHEFKIKAKPGRAPKKYCTSCGTAKKALNLKKVNADKSLVKPKEPAKKVSAKVSTSDDNIYVITPTGDKMLVASVEEKEFYDNRRKDILEHADYTGAEKDQLKTFLQLNLEEKRLEEISLTATDTKLIALLLKVSQAKADIAKTLGITRDQRLVRTESETIEEAMESVITRFQKFREENKDKFVYKCEKCGHKNITYRLNPNYKKEKKEEPKKIIKEEVSITSTNTSLKASNSVTPLEGD